MDQISSVQVIHESYIYIYIYTIYIADYCRFLRHVCPRNPSNRPELNVSKAETSSQQRSLIEMGANRLLLPSGKQCPAEKLVQLIILRSHPIIGLFLGPATPTALALILHARLFRGPKCMKTSFAPFCPRRLLIYIRAALSDHLLDTRTQLGLRGRREGEEEQEGFVGRW